MNQDLRRAPKNAELDSDESELSENEEKNLENILSIFPLREKYPFDDNIDNKTFEKVKNVLTCPICLDLYREPVYVRECMHRFCRNCIEKIIRGPNKSCPSCRKAIGSKRELRHDMNTVLIMGSIFKDLTKYLQMQDKEDEKYVQSYNENRSINKLKKSKSGRGSKTILRNSSVGAAKDFGKDVITLSDTIIEIEKETTKPKKRKINPKMIEPILIEADPKETSNTSFAGNNSNKIIDHVSEFPQAQKVNTTTKEDPMGSFLCADEKTMENLKHLLMMPNFENYLKNLEFNYSFKLEPHPQLSLLPQLESNIFRTCSMISLEQICKTLCKKLHINCKKYWDKIELFINMNGKFEPLKIENKILSDINNQYWKEFKDVQLYDIDSSIDEIIKRSYLNSEINRVLYYSIDLEEFM